MFMSKRGDLTVTNVFATIGIILITVGVLWFLASNWHQIPAVLKVLILAAATVTAYFVGYKLEQQEHQKLGHTLYMLAAILWTLSLFLIAQIFNLVATMQASANIMIIALIGTAMLAYLIQSSPVLVIAIFSFTSWVWLQTIATISTRSFEYAANLITVNQLGITGFLFGLALLHRVYNPTFARVYTWWAVLSIFGLGIWLSNQSTQLILANFTLVPMAILLPRLGIPALIMAIGIYLVLQRRRISKFDAWSGATIWISYILAVTILPVILGLKPGRMFGSIWNLGASYIISWLLFNALFIALLLLVINFGTREKRTSLVYLALWFFIVYIVARYIGFIINLSGYLAISTLFIIGGIGLVVLAFLLNKFRTSTIEKLR